MNKLEMLVQVELSGEMLEALGAFEILMKFIA